MFKPSSLYYYYFKLTLLIQSSLDVVLTWTHSARDSSVKTSRNECGEFPYLATNYMTNDHEERTLFRGYLTQSHTNTRTRTRTHRHTAYIYCISFKYLERTIC